MDGDSARSSFSRNQAARRLYERDVSNFSKEELLAHINALEMDIKGKDGIIQSLTGDLSVSSEQIMSIPPGYRLRLENTVTEQNFTIEALKEELEQKQKELVDLTNESSSLKEDASREMAELKNELEKKKAKWKHEKKDLENALKNLREAYEKERTMLDTTLNSEIDRNHLLEKQVLLMSQRIEELYQRGVAHDEEFEVIRKHLEDEMVELRRSCVPFEADDAKKISPEQISSMRTLLAQCFTKNTELNAVAINSEKFYHGIREEVQSNLQSALEKVELLSLDLKESEKRNAQLEKSCERHEVEMRRLKEELTNDFSKDMYLLNRAFHQQHQLIKATWSSCGDETPMRNLESSNEDLSEPVPLPASVNDLIERIQQFFVDLDSQLERFIELKNENDELIRENDILRQKADEVDRYRESVVLMRAELGRIKERYELMEKNQENMIMTLRKDLEISKNKCSDLQREQNDTVRLEEELNLSKTNYDELKKKFEDLAAQRRVSNVLGDGTSPGACPKCGDVSSLEVGRLSPISKFGVTSESTPPRAHQSSLITSTPFPIHLKGAGEHRVPTVDESEYQLALVRWMETCSELNKENCELKNQISDLNMQIKNLELSASGIREEMKVFDEKRKELEARLSDYAELKNQHQQLTEALKLNTLKIEGLESELKRQENLNDKLAEENLKFEEQFKENLARTESCLKEGQLDVPQRLLADLSNKVNEVLLLKGRIGTMTHAKRALEENYEQLVGVKNLYVLKLEEANRELNNCRGEVERLLQNNIKLSASNKSYDKEVRMLKIRVNHLADLKDQNWGRSEHCSLAEQMQKDILSICREAIERKFECDKMLGVEKRVVPRCDELDARHRLELLIKDNAQLVHEKEGLLATVAEQQRIINQIQKESGCDDRWIQHLDDVQNNLLLEIREQKEQHARIEEALRSTGSLHNELQREKDDKKIKIIELAKAEKKYQTEKLKAQQLEMEIKTLKQDLMDRREMIKVLEEEKSELSNDLAAVRSALEIAQEKLEYEIQCNRLRFKHAALQTANSEVLESFLTSSSEEKSVFNLDLEYHRKVRQEVESQYEQALQAMRHYLAADYTMRAQAEQSSHNNQLIRYKTIIEEQSETIEKMKSSKLIKELTEGKDTLPEYKALLENMDKCKTEMEAALSTIHDSDEALKIKKSFEEYFNYKLFLAQKLLQDEHRSQYALAFSCWKQLHDAELKLAKLQMEAEKQAEKVNENPQKLEDLNSACGDVFDGVERGLTTSQYIFHILLKSYFSHIENYSSAWCSAFRRDLKNIDAETRKEMLNFGNQIEKNMKDRGFVKTESLLCQGDGLVTAAKGFIESIRGFKSDLLSSLSQALDSLFHETKKTLGDFKKDNGRLDAFHTLEEDLETLKKEKAESEKQYRAALQLLTSDHDLEVKKLETILAELKHLSEIGCRADALLKLKEELEQKHKKEVEELRTYFEGKVADLEKNFSEEVFSQHSRKMSSSSSCTDDCSDRDKITSHPDLQCESGPMIDSGLVSVDLDELFPGSKKINELKLKGQPDSSVSRKNTKKNHCSECVGCAAKVLTRWILVESHEEIERELVQVITKQTKDELRTFGDRPSRLFTQDVTDWEVEDHRASLISKTIHQIGEECFKTVQESFKTNLIDKIQDFDTLFVGKLTKMAAVLDDKNAKLVKLEKYIADTRRAGREKTRSTDKLPRDSNANELDRLLKDRNDLDKIRNTLKILVSQMSHYVSESGNDLLRQIKGELSKLCQEGADNAESESHARPEKHVHFGGNLSNIIQELDDTLNESAHDWTLDSSSRFREDLHSCLRKLKLEAAGLYKLSIQTNPEEVDSNKMESLAEALRKENLVLQEEINELRMTSLSNLNSSGPSVISYTTHMEAVYGDIDELKSNLPSADYLQNKARKHLVQIKDPVTSKAVEDVLREGDVVIDELQTRCEDLQQQVEVADKQLRSTRQFLEEQAVEREGERDEYSREVSNLQTLLKEKDKECTAKQRINAEVLVPGAKNATSRERRVEELLKELKETSERLFETEERERLLQTELKAAIDQVYVLRDIIRNLETQVLTKSSKEIELEKKLEELAQELDERNGTQSVMAHEIETLRNQSLEDSKGFEQLQELEENIKLRFNSSVIRQFQAQIREMGKLLDHQTKELEGSQVGASNNSLSSPSEEISIREHIEFFNRSKTPEHCPSPVGLPVDDVNKLSEKIIRHARADEVILKKLGDQEIRVCKLTNYAEEIQAERDILHEQVEKLKNQIADANNKIDFLRHKADASNATANRDIILENQKLKDALSEAQVTLGKINHQLQEKDSQLENAEEVISAQQDKLRSLVQCDENALESMRLELASILAEKNKLEGLVEKYKSDLEQFGAHPAELKAILADKNEDIKFLQETLARIQNESEKSSRSSKGLKVSFAEEASNSFSPEPSKLRDCPGEDSFHFEDPPSHLNIQPLKSSTHREIEISTVQHPPLERVLDTSLDPKNTLNVSDGTMLDKLRMEMMEKNHQLVKLEQQLMDFKLIEEDLLKTKTELEDMVAAISEDKKYYEEQLTSMMSEIKAKDEKCCQLEKRLADKGLEVAKLSSDVAALQQLVAMMQEKLNDARMLAESGHVGSETIACLKDEIARLKCEAQQFEDDKVKTKSEKDALNSKIESLMSENQKLEEDLTRVELECRTNAGRYEEVFTSKEELETHLVEIRNENNRLKSELSKYEAVEKHLEKTQEHLTSLLSENESLQETLNNMRIAYENRIEEVNQFRSDASKKVELQNEVGRLKERVTELEKAVEIEIDAKKLREDQLQTVTRDLESAKLEKESLESEKESLAEASRSMQEELDNFRTSVATLRNDLSSLKKKGGPYISLLGQIDCNDVKKLYLEVSKLISEVGQLEFERNCLQQELVKVKSTSAAVVLNEAELDRLSEQISRLEAVNEELKANSTINTEQLRLEIVKLSQDIKFLQTIERQASEKLAASHDDTKKFGSRLTKMERDLNQIFSVRRSTSEKSLQTSPIPSLSSTAECVRVPETENEIQRTGGVHLDNLLTQHALNKGLDCHCDQRHRNGMLETALFDKMRLIEDLKQKLRAEESKSRALRAEKLDVELNLKTLEKINNVQEKKLDIINSQIRQISSERLQMELDVHNEKTSRLHAENELSTERMKTQSMQMENINMMENMRARLKLAMENEGKLKALVLEKHDQYESVVAKLNSIMVMERYKIESENEGCSSTPKKRLAESQEQCRTLKQALENQERINGDLNNVMMRERKSLAIAQEQLRSLEGECNKLRTDLRNEIIKREVLQEQLNGYLNADVRSPVDSDKVQSLERECARLRERISILQELNEQWRVSAYTPVLEQLNELNSNVDSLANRKRELESVVSDLEKERNFLSSQIAQMREERANLRLTSDRMDFPPSVSAKLDIYLGRYFRAESYRKSLIIQKKYLSAVLSGYENSHENTLQALAPGLQSSSKRPSFKSVALTVVSVTRMKFFVRKRKIACETAYLGLLRALGFTNSDSLYRAGRNDAQGLPSAHLPYSNSPPTKERSSEVARRHRVATASHSEYLAALQEVQKLTRKT